MEMLAANRDARRPDGRWETLLLSVALALAVFAVYYPAHHYPFLDIDDGSYVYDDAHVTGPLNLQTIRWAFTHYYADNYAPIDFLSHNLDVRMFQLNAGGHHDVNVLLHGFNAVLLFWILKRTTGYTGRSWMVAALFGLHPINVENVAWIAERKTMLSTCFFLLAMVAYRWYVEHPKPRRMAVVWIIFLVGLLAKPQVIVLPFVLLLWDYWPLRRTAFGAAEQGIAPGVEVLPKLKFSTLLDEKIPLFTLVLADAILTMNGEQGALKLKFPLYVRLGNAVLSYGRYIREAVWPSHLALMYLHPGYALPWGKVAVALVFLITVSAWVIANWRNGYLTVGWLWFLGTMVPTIGLVQFDVHAMADRFAYIAFVGLFMMICWSVAEWARRRSLPRVLLPAASLAVLLALSVATHRQLGFWSDRITLWTHTLDVMHRNWVADVRLGNYYFDHGQDDQALFHYSRVVEDQPDDFLINQRLAILEHKRGDLNRAITYYEKALALSHDDLQSAQMLANMGHAYSDLGDAQNALRCYRSSQRLAASVHKPAAN